MCDLRSRQNHLVQRHQHAVAVKEVSRLLFIGHGLGRWRLDAQRIDLHAIFPKAKTQMRTRSQASAAYVANHLALTYPHPLSNA